MEKCTNCERDIGNLETPWVFKSNIVCRRCYELLSGGSSAKKTTQTPPAQKEIVTIQKTSKYYKLCQVAGVIMLVIGLDSSCASIKQGSYESSGIFFVIAGSTAFLYGRAAAWWHHG
jgi:hypothetical protein